MKLATSKPQDRRIARRVGCRLQIMNDPMSAVADISETGARFNFHHAISLDEDIDVPIRILDRIIWARIHPLWARPTAAPQAIDVGAQFTVISDEDRETIRQYVQKSLRKPFGFLERHFPPQSKAA